MSAESDSSAPHRNPAGSQDSPIKDSENRFDVESSALSRAALRELLGRLRDPSGSGATTSDVAPHYESETSFIESDDNIYSDDFSNGSPKVSQPFLSIVLLASDASDATLNDALVALDAQSNSDFELVVVAPSSDDLDRVRIEQALCQYSSGLAGRSRVVDGPSKSLQPRTRVDALRAGAGETRGRYITVLDGTSVVFAHFVATFARLAHEFAAAVLRARAITQPMHLVTWPDGRAGFEPTSGAAPASAPHFSALEHLLEPNTPLGSFALSSDYFREVGFPFDEKVTLVEAAILGGVREAPDEVVVLLRRFDNEEIASGSGTS